MVSASALASENNALLRGSVCAPVRSYWRDGLLAGLQASVHNRTNTSLREYAHLHLFAPAIFDWEGRWRSSFSFYTFTSIKPYEEVGSRLGCLTSELFSSSKRSTFRCTFWLSLASSGSFTFD